MSADLLKLAREHLDAGDLQRARAALLLVAPGDQQHDHHAVSATKLVERRALAQTLGVTARHISALVKRGAIPAHCVVRIGRATRYDLDRIIEHFRGTSAVPAAKADAADAGAQWAAQRGKMRVVGGTK